MDGFEKDGYWWFNCGCRFEIIGPKWGNSKIPKLRCSLDKHNINHTINFNCPATWELLSKGWTKGVFQLESPLGRQWCKKMRPENLENMAALGALLRPGCIAGDTNISIALSDRKGRNINCKKMKIRDLYQKYSRQHVLYKNNIVSLNENSLDLFNNNIIRVIYSGNKEVFKPKFKLRKRDYSNDKFYNLECTADHLLLTHDRGWIELQNLFPGERVAVIKTIKKNRRKDLKLIAGEKQFRDICFYYYKYRCVFCDWLEASLDVNHIDGNRKIDNSKDNLCFVCPNHHKMYTEGKISKEQILEARRNYEIKVSEHIQWAEYLGCESIGVKDTYDISVDGPNHNFIAGNVIVHNCLRAKDFVLHCKDCKTKFPIREHNKEEDGEDYCPDCGSPNVKRVGTSMTEHYCLRKNQEELVERYHEAIDPILGTTYNVLAYQEQSMQIAVAVANFDLREADMLRKAIGKKLTEEMAKVKTLFMEKAKIAGIVSEDQAEEIFGWIEKSQRYSFNKSHSASYGETGYICAYAKTHFPIAFYRKWLEFEKDKKELAELVNDAKITSNVKIRPPDIRYLKERVHSDGTSIFFGLQDIKDVGQAQIQKLKDVLDEYNITKAEICQMDWMVFMMYIGSKLSSKTMSGFIRAGALSCFNTDRVVMEKDYEIWSALSPKEKEFTKHYFARQNRSPKEIREIIVNILKYKAYHTEARASILLKILDGIDKIPYKLEDTIDSLVYAEEELLGVALSCHITDSLLTAQETHSCKDIVNGYNGYAVLKVSLEEVRPWKIKNGASTGKYMAFIKCSDNTCQIDNVVAFAEVYQQYSHLLAPGSVVYITGKISQKGSFVIERIYEYTK